MKKIIAGATILAVGLMAGLFIPKYTEEEKSSMLVYALQNKENPSKVVVSIQILKNSEAWLVYQLSLTNKGSGASLAGFSDKKWNGLSLESREPEHHNVDADFENKYHLRYIDPK